MESRSVRLPPLLAIGLAIGLAIAMGCPTALVAAPQTPPVTDAMLRDPDPGDWLMMRRSQSSTICAACGMSFAIS